MRLKLASLSALAALVAACGSNYDDCLETSGNGDAAAMGTEAVTAGSVADFVANVGDRVYFDYDRDALRPAGVETLGRQAAWLNKYSNYTVTVNGHCDKRGTVAYNYGLGERRANTAKNGLVAAGVAGSRIQVISYGKDRPVVLGDSEWAYQENRVAITVLNQ